MDKTTNTAAIESLRTFALLYNEIAFAHLCSSALQGEGWAIDRLDHSLALCVINSFQEPLAWTRTPRQSDLLVKAICADTTRPWAVLTV